MSISQGKIRFLFDPKTEQNRFKVDSYCAHMRNATLAIQLQISMFHSNRRSSSG
ncbi:MAG: hypothetical protein AAF939_02285 [Planctomycetota bacterium]